MLSLVSPLRVIKILAIGYALLVVLGLLLYKVLTGDIATWTAIRFTLSGALALDLILLTAVHFMWKWIWAKFPKLNALLFPDLNGRWRMEIHWVGTESSGTVSATATIRQDFLRLSIEVASMGSDSETLLVVPKKDPESGRPLLYYIYRVVPKKISNQAGSSYEGAAILKFESEQTNCLRGNYFTSRKTDGYFVLQRE
ncbi:hypothetical protein [Variovorax paradoxus]|uniref:Cap15 family cyclic dinucleotide receptor domain-containing protein n=1 Tax=Variovorax paradoxus TaxID=34073 RepID=UPI001ABCA7BB